MTMQIVGLIGVIVLVGLMSILGFQIVPESAINRSAASETNASRLDPSVTSNRPTLHTNNSNTSNPPRPSSQPTADAIPTFQASVVAILSAQNIEKNSALLRGEVAVGTEVVGTTFFIYSYDQSDINQSIGRRVTYQAVLDAAKAGVSVRRVATRVQRDQTVTQRATGLAPDTTYYVRMCAEVAEALRCSSASEFKTIPGAFKPGEVKIPTISVTDKTLVANDSVQLDLTISMRDTVDGEAYLIYGESQQQVNYAGTQSYRSIQTNDEELQKTRLVRGLRGTQKFSEILTDLRADTTHYYVACVTYDGLRDGIVCTRAGSFRTASEDFGTTPRIQTSTVRVTGTTARLAGSIAMRGFNSGKGFFVYGTNTEYIAKLTTTETTMERLRQSADRFQRVLVDADVDGTNNYATTVSDLRSATTYTARLCVEYTNQNDRYREVSFVTCGPVQLFVTN